MTHYRRTPRRGVNLFSDLFNRLKSSSRAVRFGLVGALVLLVIAVVIGKFIDSSNNDTSKPDDFVEAYQDDDDPGCITIEEEAEAEKLRRQLSGTTAVSDGTVVVEEVVEVVEAEDRPQDDAVLPSTDVTTKSDAEISREIDAETGIADSERTYNIGMVEQKPSFPGGETAMFQWLGQNINYPADAAENGIQGRVVVQFTVTSAGRVADVSLVRGKYPSLDKEALRVVRAMPAWTPGRYNGKPVNVVYTLPIVFKLN